MLVDCITFYNGLDVLEIRLNTLAPYVDRFVICESPYDMVGKKKRLYFDENKDRFKDFNITHLIVDDHEQHMGGWEPYYYQIDYMMRELDQDDTVMISDFDEIPDLTNYNGEEGMFAQKLYYYYLNVYTGTHHWKGTVALKRTSFDKLSDVRRFRKRRNIIGKGWHFSYITPVSEIIEKIEAFCHRELDTPQIKEKVEQNRKRLIDPFGRRRYKLVVQEPDGPEWLLNNKERYKHLWTSQA